MMPLASSVVYVGHGRRTVPDSGQGLGVARIDVTLSFATASLRPAPIGLVDRATFPSHADAKLRL